MNTQTSLHLANINSNELSISWDQSVIDSCSQYHYNIFNQNCGICPDTNNFSHVTCQLYGIPVHNRQECMLSVQPVICNDIVGVATLDINITIQCKVNVITQVNSFNDDNNSVLQCQRPLVSLMLFPTAMEPMVK